MTVSTKIIKSRMNPKDVMIVHSCTQTATLSHLEKNIQKLSEILTGNGHPEEGISRKVALIEERQSNMMSTLKEVHDDLKEYHKAVETAKDVALTAKSALDKYRASIEGEERGIGKASTHTQVTFNNIISIIGTILVAAGLVITALIGRRSDENLKAQIDNLGTPVIINPRGIANQLPAGDSLKFYRNGEFKDGIRDSI